MICSAIIEDKKAGLRFAFAHGVLERFGIAFATGEQTVTAAAADPVVAERLNVAIGAPLLKVVRLHFDAIGRPIQHFELLAPPATYQLRMPLRGTELER